MTPGRPDPALSTQPKSKKPDTLLPYTAKELSTFDEGQLEKVMAFHTRVYELKHSFARDSLIGGIAGFIACVGSFTYLVHDNHPTSAGVVVRVTLLSTIGKMLANRL